MRLVLVGTSHHHAPIELRERVALDREQARDLAARLAEGGGEAVCLSTCNRTELYVVGADAEASSGPRSPRSPSSSRRWSRRSTACTTTRLRCISSASPPASTRSSRARARSSARCGPHTRLGTHRACFSTASSGRRSHAGRKVRAQTAIGESPASVSSAAAALAEQVFGDLDGPRDPARRRGQDRRAGGAQPRCHAARRSRSSPTARSTAREQLAQRFGAEPVPLEQIEEQLVTARRRRLVDERARLRARRGDGRARRPAASRTPAAADRPRRAARPRLRPSTSSKAATSTTSTISRPIVAETLAGRRGEAERAETIVDAEAEKFHEWQASLDVVPAIASLRARAEEIREGGAAQGGGPARPAGREPAQGGRVDHVADREQAPAPADGASEAGSRGSRRSGLC